MVEPLGKKKVTQKSETGSQGTSSLSNEKLGISSPAHGLMRQKVRSYSSKFRMLPELLKVIKTHTEYLCSVREDILG